MDDVFKEQQTQSDPNKNYYEELVGDGKKFKDNEGLARGKFESDNYIGVLEKKLDELRSELQNKNSMADMLDQLKAVTKPQDSNTPPVTTPVAPAAPDDLEAKLNELLAAREAKQFSETNFEKSKRVLIENFGDQATDVLNQKAKELGMPMPQLEHLAKTSPAAFLKLVGASDEPRPQAGVPMSPSHRQGSQSGQPVRNHAFYEKMKRENPKLYFSQQTTVQQIKDLTELGQDKYYA